MVKLTFRTNIYLFLVKSTSSTKKNSMTRRLSGQWLVLLRVYPCRRLQGVAIDNRRLFSYHNLFIVLP